MTEFQCSQVHFFDAITDAAIAAGTDATQPVLCAVHMVGREGISEVEFYGTDRFMLVRRTIPTIDPLAADISALIPTDQVKMLAGVLKPNAFERRVDRAAQPLAVAVAERTLTAGPVTVSLDVDHEPIKNLGSIAESGEGADAQINILPVDLALLLRVSKLTVHRKRRDTRIYFTKGQDGQPARLSILTGDEEIDRSTKVIVMPARVR